MWACGVTWIAHLASDQRVAGSNPVMPVLTGRLESSNSVGFLILGGLRFFRSKTSN